MKIWDMIVKIAQIIVKGRQAGMWSEDQSSGGVVRKDPEPFNQPHQPGRRFRGRQGQ